MYILIYTIKMRKVELRKGELSLRDEVIGFIEKKVTKFGNGAKVDCPREYLGRRAYILICKK